MKIKNLIKRLLKKPGNFANVINQKRENSAQQIKRLRQKAASNTMGLLKQTIPFLDDIFLALGLISFVVASYLVNAVLGTYVLGIAFFVAAFFAGTALRSPAMQQVIGKFQRKK